MQPILKYSKNTKQIFWMVPKMVDKLLTGFRITVYQFHFQKIYVVMFVVWLWSPSTATLTSTDHAFKSQVSCCISSTGHRNHKLCLISIMKLLWPVSSVKVLVGPSIASIFSFSITLASLSLLVIHATPSKQLSGLARFLLGPLRCWDLPHLGFWCVLCFCCIYSFSNI